MNLLFTLLIAIVAAISSFIPATGRKMFDFRKNGLDVVNRPGWYFIGCLSIVIGLTALQNLYNQNESDIKEEKAKKDQNYRDFIQKRAYDSTLASTNEQANLNNRQTILAITQTQTEILGKYGYKLDSATNKLVKIVRDSSKTKVIIADDPVLQLCYGYGIVLEEFKDGIQHCKINVCSNDAGSSNFNVSFQVAARDSLGKLYYMGEVFGLTSDTRMAKDTKITTGFTSKSEIKADVIFIYIFGTYKSLDKTKVFPINEVYAYNVKEKLYTGSLIEKVRRPIINLLKEHNSLVIP